METVTCTSITLCNALQKHSTCVQSSPDTKTSWNFESNIKRLCNQLRRTRHPLLTTITAKATPHIFRNL